MAEGDPVNPGNPKAAAAGAAAPAGTPAEPGGTKAFVFDDDAINSLPEDIRYEPSIQLFKGKPLPDVIKSYVNAQRMIGADKVALPTGKDDTPEAWEEFYKRLGRPDDPSGYEFKQTQMPQGVERNADIENAFRIISHKIGLTPRQAGELYGSFLSMQAAANHHQQEAARQSLESAQEALKQEWGNRYEEKLTIARRVIDTYGGKAEEIAGFKEKFGNDPVAIKVLASIGGLVSEGNFVKGETPAFLSTPQQAKRKYMDILSNKQNPLHEAYHNRQHIRHQDAVDEVERLFVVTHGNEVIDKK